MKRLKTLNPAPAAGPRKITKAQRFLAIAVIATAAFFCLACVAAFQVQSANPEGLITDETAVAAYDSEFAKFLGAGHRISEYSYVRAVISDNFAFGYGPLCDVTDFQVIVGETGAVGVVAHGKCKFGQWEMNPVESKGTETFILVFEGCVAPQAWWNHPVTSATLCDIPLTTGGYLSELMVWVPWPDDLDFDTPDIGATIYAHSWYWDGSQYVQSKFVDSPQTSTSTSPSQISIKGAPRGAFPHFKQLYDIIRE